MASNRETFWDNESFAFVGHSARKPFPRLSFEALKKQGRTVFAIDPSVASISGTKAYDDLASLPEPVSALVLELPRGETAAWVQRAADAGIKDVWIHMLRDTGEARSIAEANGINLRTGSCAMMYVSKGLSYHSVHKRLDQALGRY